MKINNKGFSLVELLAVIGIIGILSGLATVAYTQYLSKARNQAFDNLFTNMRVGAEQYMIQNNMYLDNLTLSAKELLDDGHLNEMQDPFNKNVECDYNNSKVVMTEISTTGLKKYQYVVTIKCPSGEETRTVK